MPENEPTGQDTTDGDKSSQEGIDEDYKDRISTLSVIIDSGLSQYEVEWQRIGNMQQSAGVLIAGLAIVVSALLGFLSLDPANRLVAGRPYLDDLVYPTDPPPIS